MFCCRINPPKPHPYMGSDAPQRCLLTFSLVPVKHTAAGGLCHLNVTTCLFSNTCWHAWCFLHFWQVFCSGWVSAATVHWVNVRWMKSTVWTDWNIISISENCISSTLYIEYVCFCFMTVYSLWYCLQKMYFATCLNKCILLNFYLGIFTVSM